MSTILTFAKGFVTVLNFGFPLFLAVVGALALKYSTDISDAQVVFMGIYLFLFAAILFIYELLQVLSCPALDLMYKKNFGYLYGIYGKGLYTFLIGIFAFGLSGGNVNKEVE